MNTSKNTKVTFSTAAECKTPLVRATPAADAAELDALKALAGRITEASELPIAIGLPAAAAILRIVALVAQQAARIAKLEQALLTVERWQLPPTGKFWEDGSPTSYAVEYGSKGERDYMRRVAQDAVFGLDNTTKEGK